MRIRCYRPLGFLLWRLLLFIKLSIVKSNPSRLFLFWNFFNNCCYLWHIVFYQFYIVKFIHLQNLTLSHHLCHCLRHFHGELPINNYLGQVINLTNQLISYLQIMFMGLLQVFDFLSKVKFIATFIVIWLQLQKVLSFTHLLKWWRCSSHLQIIWNLWWCYVWSVLIGSAKITLCHWRKLLRLLVFHMQVWL